MEELSELEAIREVCKLLARVHPSRRARVVVQAVESLTPRPYAPPAHGGQGLFCLHCGKVYEKRSSNQKYCGFRCHREAGAQRRLAESARKAQKEYDALMEQIESARGTCRSAES